MGGGNSTAGHADPLIFKGSSYIITSVRLATTELASIATFLSDKVAQAPSFFENVPVVIDLEDVNSRPLDLPGLLKVLRSHGMVPTGIRGGSQRILGEAADIGLARLNGSAANTANAAKIAAVEVAPEVQREPQPAAAAAVEPAVQDAPQQSVKTKLVTTPVRGGQQLYAQHTDLILLASVNQGAEVLADGHVHVYGPLRGRALAGARGNRNARIFTTCLEAELLSIAGTYQVIDDDLPEQLRGKPAQVYLDGDSLKIEPL